MATGGGKRAVHDATRQPAGAAHEPSDDAVICAHPDAGDANCKDEDASVAHAHAADDLQQRTRQRRIRARPQVVLRVACPNQEYSGIPDNIARPRPG